MKLIIVNAKRTKLIRFMWDLYLQLRNVIQILAQKLVNVTQISPKKSSYWPTIHNLKPMYICIILFSLLSVTSVFPESLISSWWKIHCMYQGEAKILLYPQNIDVPDNIMEAAVSLVQTVQTINSIIVSPIKRSRVSLHGKIVKVSTVHFNLVILPFSR